LPGGFPACLHQELLSRLELKVRRVPTAFFWIYSATALGGLVLGAFPLISVRIISSVRERDEFLGLVVWGISQAVFLIFLFRIWSIIPERYARCSGLKAVALLFVPLYNFYWIFPVIHGWSRSFNYYLLSRHRGVRGVSEGLGLAVSLVTSICYPAAIAWLFFQSDVLYALLAVLLPALVLLNAVFIWKTTRSSILLAEDADRRGAQKIAG
jgi:hypothetical protein